MTESSERVDADLQATAITRRERRVTNLSTTLARLVLVAAVAACGGGGGGGAKKDTYAKATEVQQACCEHLNGGPRDQCLRGIVRVDDHEVAGTAVNQATYDCVVSHFSCDATTGRPTQASAQAQLECIQDLQ